MWQTEIKRWNKTNIVPLNIIVDDYVKISTHKHRNHKLQSKWRRPMIVEKARSLVFISEDLMNANEQTVHP